MNNEPWQAFFAGFDLGGWRQPDGTLVSGLSSNTVLPDWPKEITVFGNTYTLDYVKVGASQPGKGVWENAIYV